MKPSWCKVGENYVVSTRAVSGTARRYKGEDVWIEAIDRDGTVHAVAESGESMILLRYEVDCELTALEAERIRLKTLQILSL